MVVWAYGDRVVMIQSKGKGSSTTATELHSIFLFIYFIIIVFLSNVSGGDNFHSLSSDTAYGDWRLYDEELLKE